MDSHDAPGAAQIRRRIAGLAEQVERRLAGEITEDRFRPLRLANGVTLQPHSYVLHIGVPESGLSTRQLRLLADVARTYDKGYCHFTARWTVEFRWPALADIPAILADLASVGLQAVEVSADCLALDAGSGPEKAISADQLEALADFGPSNVRSADIERGIFTQNSRESSHVDEAKAA